ncbi:MAG: hypothetical protein ACI4DY_13360 [Monoglobaceae bacterium]
MNWEIVAGIITLLGAFGLVAGWTSKLSRTLASLETTLTALDKTLKELRDSNRESHKEFYTKLENHEGRITALETKAEKSE